MVTPTCNNNNNKNANQIDLDSCLQYLLKKEEGTYSSNHLGKYDKGGDDKRSQVVVAIKIKEIWRKRIYEWFFVIVDYFAIDRNVVSIAKAYIDNKVVLSNVMKQNSSETLSAKDYQLLATACLYTAVKLHGVVDCVEGKRKEEINVDTFVELSQGVFKAEEIERMEHMLLPTLERERLLNPATPEKFILGMIRFIPKWSSADSQKRAFPTHSHVTLGIFDTARYLTELVLMKSTTEEKNSIVAYASILYAIDALKGLLPLPPAEKEYFLNAVEIVTGYKPDMVQAMYTKQLLLELCTSLQESGLLLELVPSNNESSSHDNKQGMASVVSFGINDNSYKPSLSFSYPHRRSE